MHLNPIRNFPKTRRTLSKSIMSASTTRPRQSTVAQHLAGTQDGWHGKVIPEGPFKPEKDRYRLYIGLFCPFAHRANLIRHLKKLQSAIPLTVVKPYPKGDANGYPGWKFPVSNEEYPGATPDPLYHSEYLHNLYFKADKDYQGRYSVPVLWDTKTETIVTNESTELLRDWEHAFDDVIEDPEAKGLNFYPEKLRAKIDEICEWMQRDLNTGVYKAGFADSQEAYDKNVLPVFAALNKMEKTIAQNGGPFVLGKELTEVDLRLYPTIIRFDTVYVQHFKCNLGTIRHDYPSINNWMKGLFHGIAKLPGGNNVYGFGEVDIRAIAEGRGDAELGTVDFRHIKENYTKSHSDINPKAITPRGPWPDVESGFEEDFSKVRVGSIDMPEVLDFEAKLP